jgi:hypothetical protein
MPLSSQTPLAARGAPAAGPRPGGARQNPLPPPIPLNRRLLPDNAGPPGDAAWLGGRARPLARRASPRGRCCCCSDNRATPPGAPAAPPTGGPARAPAVPAPDGEPGPLRRPGSTRAPPRPGVAARLLWGAAPWIDTGPNDTDRRRSPPLAGARAALPAGTPPKPAAPPPRLARGGVACPPPFSRLTEPPACWEAACWEAAGDAAPSGDVPSAERKNWRALVEPFVEEEAEAAARPACQPDAGAGVAGARAGCSQSARSRARMSPSGISRPASAGAPRSLEPAPPEAAPPGAGSRPALPAADPASSLTNGSTICARRVFLDDGGRSVLKARPPVRAPAEGRGVSD